MTHAPDVSLRNIVKTFGGVTAVDNVTLEIPHKSFVSLLGPSGCGKTTTLRMIGGFEVPDSGEVLIRGESRGITPPYARDTSMVFQSYALFPHMTVAENIAFGLHERGVQRREIRERVQAMLDLIKLPGIAGRKPHQLSGGQQQRVALARSLVIEPKVLLLDEPLGALDSLLRKQMQIELKRIQQQLGITFVYVTHDQEEAITMSDRIVVMREGMVEQEGTAREIFDRPASRYVAEFMGAENIIPVEVVSTDAGANVVNLAGRQLIVPGENSQLNGCVSLVIRPERIRLITEDGWLARVVSRTDKGASVAFHMELDAGITLTAHSASDHTNHIGVGDEVRIDFPGANASLVPTMMATATR